MKPKQIMGASALLVLIVLGTACAKQPPGALQQRADAQTTPPPSAATPAPNPEAEVPRVDVAELKRLVAEGQAVIIDVRGAESYQTEHVKGAISYPLDKIEAGNFKDLPRDKRIISYCT